MNDYNFLHETGAAENRPIKREGFKTVRMSIFAVAFSAAAGLWVMITLAGSSLVGINAYIFVLLAAVASAVMMHLDGNLNLGHAVFWVAVVAAIGSTYFRMQEPPGLAVLFMPTVLVFLSIYAAKRTRENVISQFFYRHFAFFIHFWELFVVKLSVKDETKRGAALKILLGIGISIILLLIIIPLMFSADVMFKVTMEKFFDLEAFFRTFGSRIIWGAIITMLAFAFLFTITVKKDLPQTGESAEKKREDMSAMIITVLVAIGAVFALFTIIQAWYLFFETGGGLPQGYTYTEYAVKGYWNQASLTAVNLIVVLGALALSRKSEGRSKRVINVLLTVMSGLNVYLVMSAAYKMRLYESTYGFTEKRLLVYFILLFELMMLGLLIYSIFKRNFPFIKTVVYLTAAYFSVVACLNLDAISLKQNIKRYEETGKMDYHYMLYEATNAPYVVRDFYFKHYDRLSDQERADIAYRFTVEKNTQVYTYAEDGEEYTSVYGQKYADEKWYEFNLARYRKYKAGLDIEAFLNQQK